MNRVVTIPKEVTKSGDLVVLPKEAYDEMLSALKGQSQLLQKKALGLSLADAIKEYKSGQYYGPFGTAQEGIKFLKSRKTRK